MAKNQHPEKVRGKMLVPARDLAGIGLWKKISILEFSFHFKVVVNSYIYTQWSDLASVDVLGWNKSSYIRCTCLSEAISIVELLKRTDQRIFYSSTKQGRKSDVTHTAELEHRVPWYLTAEWREGTPPPPVFRFIEKHTELKLWITCCMLEGVGLLPKAVVSK